MATHGRNGGITGVVDIAGVPDTTPKFIMRVYATQMNFTASADSIAGRGDGDWPENAYLTSTGQLVLSGQEQLAGRFLPSNFNGHAGSITFEHDANKTESIPVLFTGASLSYDEKEETTTLLGLTATITGPSTYTGWDGDPVGAADPTGDTKQLWAGMSKTSDPSGLLSGASQVWHVWGVEDDDSAEAEAIAAILVSASTAPLTELKQRTATLTRLSSRRIKITIVWGLKSTADDELNPRTIALTDVQGLDSTDAVAVLIDPDSPPDDPSGDDIPAGYKLGTREDIKLVDGKTARVYHWVLADSKDLKEFEPTKALTDYQSLTSTAALGTVFVNDTPPDWPDTPDGLKPVNYYDVPLTSPDTSNQSLRVFNWGKKDSADELLNPQTTQEQDPAGLESKKTTAAIIDPDSPPDDPDAPDGYVLHHRQDVKEVDGTGTVRVYHWALLSSQDEKEFEQSKTLTDPNDLTSSTTLGKVFTTGSPPDDPDAPDGQKVVEYFDVPLTNAGTTDLSMRVYRWGKKDSADELINPRTTEEQDPAGLESARTTAAIIDPDSPPDDPDAPDGYVLHHREDVKEVDGTGTLRVYHWALLSSQDEKEFAQTKTLIDPNALNSATTLGKVYTTGSPPSTPSAPSGLKLVEYFDVPLTNAGTTDLSMRVYRWGIKDSKDEALNPNIITETDPQGLRSKDQTAAMINPASPPSDPSAPSGFKLTGKRDVKLVDGTGTVRVYQWGLNDSKDDAQFEHDRALADPNDLDSTTVLADVFTTGSPPSTPSAPSGQKLVNTVDIPLTSASTSNQSVRVWTWGKLDSIDQITIPGTTAEYDAINGPSSEVTTLVTVSSTFTTELAAAAAYADNQGTLSFDLASVVNRTAETQIVKVRSKNDDGLQQPAFRHMWQSELYESAAMPTAGFGGGYGSGDCYVRVAQLPGPLIGGPGGYTLARLMHYREFRTIGLFRVHRRFIISSEDDVTTYCALDQMRQVNDDTFCGLPEHSVMYVGAMQTNNWALGFDHLLEIDYEFKYDSWLHLNDGRITVGDVTTNSSSTLINALGDVLATDYFPSDWVLLWPDDSDFSEFKP